MTEEKWVTTLSTTEKNNVGSVLLRKNNENSEVMKVKLIKISKPYDLTALKVFFVTHFSGKDGLKVPIQKEAKIIDAKEGIFEFIFDEDCMQKVGRQEAYFEIYDYDKFLDTTQNFTYEIISSSRGVKADFTPYIETWEEAEKMLNEGTAKVLTDKTNKLESKKADITDVENRLEKKTDNETFVAITADMQRQIESTQSGMIGDFNSVEELKKAYPKGEKGYAIVYFNENGEKIPYSYTYKNGNWTKGNVFNGIKLPEDSVKSSNLTRELREGFGDYYKLELEEKKGYLLYNSGNINNIVSNPSFVTLETTCLPGDVFHIDTHVNNSTTSACIFWDEKGDYITDFERGVDKKLYNYEVVAPFGAKKITITSIWAGNPPLYPAIKKYKSNNTNKIIVDTKSIDERLSKYKEVDSEIIKGYLTYSSQDVHTIREHESYQTIVEKCLPNELWNLDTTLNGTTTSAVIFWDKNGKFIKDLERGGTGDFSWYKFKTPDNCYYNSVTSLTKGLKPILRKAEEGELADVDKRLSFIEDSLKNVQPKKNFLLLGDSTVGMYDDENSVGGVISSTLSANVYNGAFGGSRMGKHGKYWDAFSVYRIADELVKDNSDTTKWKLQDDAINANAEGLWVDGFGNPAMPGYYPKRLNVLKIISLFGIDGIILESGQNDYTGANLPDNSENKFDTNTYGGSLRYSLSKLMSKFINTNFLICTPTYRIWFNDDGSFKEDSDTKDYAGTGTLTVYVDKTIEIAKEFKIPVFDAYRSLSINKYNFNKAFTYPDGTHHDKNGRKIFGEGIAKKLLTL